MTEQTDDDFYTPAHAAWDRWKRTGEGVTAEEVIAKLRAKLEERRRELQRRAADPSHHSGSK